MSSTMTPTTGDDAFRLPAKSLDARITDLGQHPLQLSLWGLPIPVRSLSCAPSAQGPLAQSVEQLTFNQLVEGSNPSRPTI